MKGWHPVTIVSLKHISGRTTPQEPGRNSVIEGGTLFVSPRGFDFMQTRIVTDTSGLSQDDVVANVLKDLGVTDDEVRRCIGRGFRVIIDWDMFDV